MKLTDIFFGKPLASHEEGEQRIGTLAGIPLLGLDALASAAYGPEAALTLLIPLSVLGIGLLKTFLSGGRPAPVVAPSALPAATATVSLWLLLHAFSSGCTAMTGVKAVSNGVSAFRSPSVVYARRTLTAIIAILAVLLAGIAFLAQAYGIGATEPGQPGYQSVLSQLVAAIVGKGVFYYVTIGTILAVLALSANTGFADFPRLCRVIAQDDFLPHAFASRGRRLVFSYGIYVLATLAGILLIVFGGITDRLIPLFAVGAFLAFTLSQAGMVAHWRRIGGRHAGRNMLINGIGATATAITLLVVLVAKFTEGAWVTLLLIPVMLIIFLAVRRHYQEVARELDYPAPLNLRGLRYPVVVVPIKSWNRLAHKALRFALKLSEDVIAVQIRTTDQGNNLAERWPQLVEAPTRALDLRPPRLVVIQSPYRRLVGPLLDYIMSLKDEYPDRQIAVIIPDLVEHHWYHYLLHKQQGEVLKALLLLHGDQRVVIINVPWYLKA